MRERVPCFLLLPVGLTLSKWTCTPLSPVPCHLASSSPDQHALQWQPLWMEMELSLLQSTTLNWYPSLCSVTSWFSSHPAVHVLCPQWGLCYLLVHIVFPTDAPQACSADSLWSDSSTLLSRSTRSLEAPLTYSWPCHNPRSLPTLASQFFISDISVTEESHIHLQTLGCCNLGANL